MRTILYLIIMVCLSGSYQISFAQTHPKEVKKFKKLNAQKVIENYLDAIGGRKKFLGVYDRTVYMSGTVEGIKVNTTLYQKSPNKYMQLTKVGTSTQKVIFNGKKGFLVVDGQIQDITGPQLEKLKYQATYKLIAHLKAYDVKAKFDSLMELDGKKTYVIELILPNGNIWKQFYDVSTKLKVKEITPVETPSDTLYQNTYFSDYKTVNGIKYPFAIRQTLGSQIFEFKVDSIKTNTGLIDRNFEVNN